MLVLALISLGLAAFPALLYLANLRQFLPPPQPADNGLSVPQISVLIPARNEEHAIAASVESVLANTGVELEVIVLDDHSTDGTADVVGKLAARDSRVRLETAPPLPHGWCGKQHACFALSKFAKYETFVFLDADVRLTPDALSRIEAFRQQSGADLVSGFPRQETGTILEKLVIPLINWLLMCYLPMSRMRSSLQPGLGAGCGQLFLTTRESYTHVGGHKSVKGSLHDGVTLPRAYRKCGYKTDICDATNIATCRMYRSASQVWYGLAKNAREGLGAWPLILVWTLLLFVGHVMPWLMLAIGLDFTFHGEIAKWFIPTWNQDEFQLGVYTSTISGVACVLSLLPRIHAATRFRATPIGAILHPIGVAILLGIQWYSTVRAWLGRPVGWKGRDHPLRDHTSSSSATA